MPDVTTQHAQEKRPLYLGPIGVGVLACTILLGCRTSTPGPASRTESALTSEFTLAGASSVFHIASADRNLLWVLADQGDLHRVDLARTSSRQVAVTVDGRPQNVRHVSVSKRGILVVGGLPTKGGPEAVSHLVKLGKDGAQSTIMKGFILAAAVGGDGYVVAQREGGKVALSAHRLP